MSGKTPADGLINWAHSTAWAAMMDHVITEHLGPACEDSEVGLKELPDLIDGAVLSNLMGCAFESFLTTVDDDGNSVVDDYLKRRGWKELARTRDYLKALRDSTPSIYEVSEIAPGVGFRVRDLVRGGEPVQVSEKLGSTGLKPWSRIYTRIITVRDTTMMSGSVLVLDFKLADDILKLVRKTIKQAPKAIAEFAMSVGIPNANASSDPLIVTEITLAGTTRHVCRLWLGDLLYRLLDAPPPKLANSDGDPLDMQTLHFPLRPTARPDEVRAALAGIEQLAPDLEDVWSWCDTELVPGDDGALVRQPVQGATIRGTITLKERTLTLFVNSQRRAREGRAFLEIALAGLSGRPLVEHELIERNLQAARQQPRRTQSSSDSTLSADEERAAIKTYLDLHCRKLLDEPIPVLGGKTPRQAVTSRRGCEKTVQWLKNFENHSAALGPGDEPLGYDFTWMWEELGIAAKRM